MQESKFRKIYHPTFLDRELSITLHNSSGIQWNDHFRGLSIRNEGHLKRERTCNVKRRSRQSFPSSKTTEARPENHRIEAQTFNSSRGERVLCWGFQLFSRLIRSPVRCGTFFHFNRYRIPFILLFLWFYPIFVHIRND